MTKKLYSSCVWISMLHLEFKKTKWGGTSADRDENGQMDVMDVRR